MDELATLEEIVLGRKGRSLPDRHAAGCFLFMVFARARFSDMMNVGKLEFDLSSSDKGTRGYVDQVKNFLFGGPQGQAAAYDCNDEWSLW